MKKIALIYSASLNSLNGASKVVKSFYDNRNLLEDQGIQMDFYSPDIIGSKLASIPSMDGWKPSWRKKIIHKLDIFGIIRTWYNINRRSEKIVKKFINSGNVDKYDLIYVHEVFTAYKLIKKLQKIPKIVLTLHTTGSVYSMLYSYYPLLKYTLFNHIYLRMIKNTIFNNIDRVVLNSEIARNNFVELHPSLKPKFSTFVNNGIANITFSKGGKASEVKEIVCVGSITERKGQRFIVESVKRLTESGSMPEVHFTLVGDGNILQELETICNNNKLTKYITFVGAQTDVIQYLEKADIFILPSLDEGQPISIIEAMRTGLPIVSTPVGGIPYLVKDGINGMLISPSEEGIRDFLSQLKDMNWVDMGKQSRQYFEREFTIERMVQKYSSIFKDEI